MMQRRQRNIKLTYAPRDVCSSSVVRVETPGHRQLFASSAYLNSSSQTKCSVATTTIIIIIIIIIIVIQGLKNPRFSKTFLGF